MRTAIDSMGVADSLAQTTARAQADGVGQGLADVQQLQERIDDLLRRDAQSHATIRRLLEEARAHQGVQVPASPQSPPGRIPWQMDPGATDGIRRAAQRYASLSRGPLARNRGKIAAAYLAVAAILAPSAALGGVIIAAPTAAVGYAGVRGWEEWQTRREVGKVGDRLVVLVDRLHSAPLDPTAREQLIEAIRNELQVMAFAWGRRTALHERGIISRFRTLRAEMAVRRVIRRGKADERTLRQIATCDMFNEDARERAVDFYAHVGLDPDDVGSLTTKDMQEICDRALDRRPNHERREIDSAAPEPGSAEVGL